MTEGCGPPSVATEHDIFLRDVVAFAQSVGSDAMLGFMQRRRPASVEVFLRRLHVDIKAAIDRLMAVADHVQTDGEEALSNRIIHMLTSNDGYEASTETNNRGHVDLIVRSKHLQFDWLGEAKIHKDYDYLEEGMKQLLTRYCGGLNQHAGLVVYVFGKNAKLVCDRWRAYLVKHNVCELQGTPVDVPGHPLWLQSDHVHKGSGLTLTVTHFFVPLFYRPEDRSATGPTR